MGGALAKAVSEAGYKNDILLSDIDKEKVKALSEEISAIPSDAEIIAKECKFIFIGAAIFVVLSMHIMSLYNSGL